MFRMTLRCAVFSGCIACVALFALGARALDSVESDPLPCRAGVPKALDGAMSDAMTLRGPAIEDPLSSGGVEIVGEWRGTRCGTGADCWGDGNYAYWGHFGTGCVDVIDITDPTNPTFVSSYEPPNPDRNASAQDVKVHDGIGFVAYEGDGNNGLGIVDFRDPSNPVQLTTVTVSRDGVNYNRVHNLFYSDGYLYIANSTNNFAVVDLTEYDPDNPPAHISEMKWHVRGVGRQFVHDITVQGNRLYASAWSDIVVFDVGNIANEPPVLLGSGAGQSAHAAWATDDGQFVVVTEERRGGGAKLYSLTDDGNGGLDVALLDEVGEGGNAFSAHNPIIVGERVYTSWYESGLIIHEIDRNAGQLVEVGRVDPGSTWGVYPLLGLDRIILGGFDHFVIVSAPDSQVQVNPSLFQVTRGVQAGGDLPDLFDSDDMGDVIGEITNVFAGRVKAILDAREIKADISLPSVIRANSMEVLTQRHMTSFRACFDSPCGRLWTGVIAGETGFMA